MTGGTLGGGILLVALALLWVVVLVPSWARGRQQRVTEQHAAQIQRTVRLLAETAEVPKEHVLEASAKEAFKQQKLLKEARERQAVLDKLERERMRAEQRLAEYQKKKEVAMQRSELRRAKLSHPGLKPVRVGAALAVVFGALGLLVGAGMAIGGLGLATFVVSAGALALGGATLVVLAPGRAAVQSDEHTPSVPVAEAPRPQLVDFSAEADAAETARAAYAEQQARAAAKRERARAMSRARAQNARPSAQVNQTDSILLREAQNESPAGKNDRANTEHTRDEPAEAAPKPAAQRAHPQLDVEAKSRRLQAQEKLRAMGVVGDLSQGATNLDEALRRRRNIS